MDFEFTKNTMLGEYRAHFAMEHLIFGRLLEDEIQQNRTKIDQLLALADKSAAAPISDFQWSGTELVVLFHDYEVTVVENSVHQDIEDDFEENLHLYDSESTASCGLEDFNELIRKWLNFINE
jgi:hypothetical protein